MPPRDSDDRAWLSYDSVAETYERVAVPWFTPMARDLVAAAGMSAGMRVLDVGTGTGLTAGLAAERIGLTRPVVGVDPSLRMLGLARRRPGVTVVRAGVPGLPFSDATFDVALANLVLSHFPDLDHGLADLRRVLRPGGRVGVTAWGPGVADEDDDGTEADQIVASVREQCGMSSNAPVAGAPWEERLRSKAELRGALTAAGFDDVEARLSTYRTTFRVDDFLAGWGGLGRYLRWHAGLERWHDFSERAATALRARFGETVVVVKQLWVTTATRPIVGE